MKNRKILTAIAEKVMTGVLTILMAISVTACGSTKEQANPAATEVTEAVVTTETESETATEAKAENEDVTETEAMTETETEEPVLFRIRISYGDGVNIGDLPSNKEANEIMWVDRGTEFDVYSIYENEDEGHSYYEVRYNGKKEYVWVDDAEIIE